MSHCPLSRKEQQRGLTLLEVLVALAIFATAGLAIMKAATDHIRSIAVLEQSTFATWVASNRLTQVQLETQFPPQNNRSGTMMLADREWHWRQRVLTTTDENMRQVEVSVFLQADSDSPVTTLTSFVAKP